MEKKIVLRIDELTEELIYKDHLIELHMHVFEKGSVVEDRKHFYGTALYSEKHFSEDLIDFEKYVDRVSQIIDFNSMYKLLSDQPERSKREDSQKCEMRCSEHCGNTVRDK